MLKKQKGFTILEALIMAGITGGLSYGAISIIQDNVEKEMATSFIKEVSAVVKAVDHRVAVDGYDATRWTTTNWNSTEEVINNLIREELVTTTECNNSGSWLPRMPEDSGSKPISCNHWEGNDFNGMTLRANLTMDGANFIERFDIFVGFESRNAFSENFQDIKYGIENVDETRNQERSGEHGLEFVSALDGSLVSMPECIRMAENCVLNLFLERDGGLEYLKLNGINSIVNNNMSFLDTTGVNAPLQCIRWREDNSGVWTRAIDQSCGVGIYRDINHPAIVEVAAETGTFNRALLNQDCNVYTTSGNGIAVTGTAPCGLMEDGSIIQVVENFHANILISDEGNFNELVITELVANNVTAQTLEVSGLAEIQELIVNGDTNVGGNITFGNDVFVGNNTTASSVNITGVLNGGDISGTTVSAPIGNFANINSELIRLDLKANEIRTDFNSLSAGDSDVPDPNLITTPGVVEEIDIVAIRMGDWGDWVVIPNTLVCTDPTPLPSTKEYGVVFQQTMNCSEDYKREREVWEVWEDGKESFVGIDTETKTENFVVTQNAVGTNVVPVVVRTERTLSGWVEVSQFNCRVASTSDRTETCKYDGSHRMSTRLNTTTNEGTPSWQYQWGSDFFDSGRADSPLFREKVSGNYTYKVGQRKFSDFKHGVQIQEFEVCRVSSGGATQYTKICDVLERQTATITYYYSNNTERTDTETTDRIVEDKIVDTWADSCRDKFTPDCV